MSLVNIAPALLKAQRNMSNAKKDSKNPFFKSKFADLNSVREAVTPALHDAGISILQLNVTYDGADFVRTMLLHESGEAITSDTRIVVKEQNNPQALGSAISYARRYGLSSMLSVGASDDDGNLGAGVSVPNLAKATPAVVIPTPSSMATDSNLSGITNPKETPKTFRKPKAATTEKDASNLDEWV